MSNEEKELNLQQTIEEIYNNKNDFKVKDRAVEDYERSYKEGKIVIPDIQRNEQYTIFKKSLIIESIFRGIPIPPICLLEKRNGKTLLIDGLQRTSSIIGYINNEYSLQHLQYFTQLEDLYFKDLPQELQTIILNYDLQMQIIPEKNNGDENYVRDIFIAINKGSEQLSLQQIREAMFFGEFIKQLRKFVEDNEDFFQKKIIKPSLGLSKKKGKHTEFFLDCLATTDLYLLNDFKNMEKNAGDRIDIYLQKNENNKEGYNIFVDCMNTINFISDEIGYKYLMTRTYRQKYQKTNTVQIGKKIIVALYTLIKSGKLNMYKIQKDIDGFRVLIQEIVCSLEFEDLNNKRKGSCKAMMDMILEGLGNKY